MVVTKRKYGQMDADSPQFPRNTKQRTRQVSNLATLVKQATNDGVALSSRLNLALKMRKEIKLLDTNQVVDFLKIQQHLVVKLADALLHTAYVPLQQLFYMSIASLLSTLNGRNDVLAAAALHRFRESVKQIDDVLLSSLPVDEVVEVIDSDNTIKVRKQVNALNRSSRICRTYIVRKCWISSSGKGKLVPIAVDKWLDFGGTMVTFYHQLPRETILYNMPYICVERLELDETRCLAYIFTKSVVGLDGINVVAFILESADFPAFVDTLCAVRPEITTIQTAPHPVPVGSNSGFAATCELRCTASKLHPIHHKTPSPTAKPNKRPPPQNLAESRAISIKAEMAPVASAELPSNLPTTELQLAPCITTTTSPVGRIFDAIVPLHMEAVGAKRGARRSQISAIPTIQRVREVTVRAALRNPYISMADTRSSSCQTLTPAYTERNTRPIRDCEMVAASVETLYRCTNITESVVTTARVWRCRSIQDRARYFLPERGNDMQPWHFSRASSTNSTAALTKAKAECLKNLKESTGSVEEPEPGYLYQPRLLVIVLAFLLLVSWTLLIVQLSGLGNVLK